MSKTINDIVEAIPLAEGSRNALIVRIKEKYHIKPISSAYRKIFSEYDFNFIVDKEKKRNKSNFRNGSYSTNGKSIYYINSRRGLYTILTEYGGII